MQKWMSKKVLGVAVGTILIVGLAVLVLFRSRPAVANATSKLPSL